MLIWISKRNGTDVNLNIEMNIEAERNGFEYRHGTERIWISKWISKRNGTDLNIETERIWISKRNGSEYQNGTDLNIETERIWISKRNGTDLNIKTEGIWMSKRNRSEYRNGTDVNLNIEMNIKLTCVTFYVYGIKLLFAEFQMRRLCAWPRVWG